MAAEKRQQFRSKVRLSEMVWHQHWEGRVCLGVAPRNIDWVIIEGPKESSSEAPKDVFDQRKYRWAHVCCQGPGADARGDGA